MNPPLEYLIRAAHASTMTITAALLIASPRSAPGAIAQEAYLKTSNTGADDEFGFPVAASGDTVVIGARFEDSNATGVNGNQANNSARDSGAAYIFVRQGTTWVQQAYLKASNTEAGDEFGFSAALSGDTVVVGAPHEWGSANGVNGNQSDNGAISSGAAYVFVRNGTTWSQQAYLKASNTGTEDWFGWSVAISGDTIVVGAFFEDSGATGVNGNQGDDTSAPDGGAAYVFVRNGTTWTQQAYLKASNNRGGGNFGSSVAISGDTAVVGAGRERSNATGINGNQSDNSLLDAGAAYVFVRTGTTWSQQAYLKASNTEEMDSFGIVAVSGDTVVVGAPGEDSDANGVNHGQSDNSSHDAGAAYVFVRNGTTWTQQAYLKASNSGTGLDGILMVGDAFGGSVAVLGDRVVVGARLEDSKATGVNGNQGDEGARNAGAVYVFSRSGTSWSQQAYLKASNPGGASPPDYYNGDRFGGAVALAETSVVVGATYEESNATGVNGNQSSNSSTNAGAAYVFSGFTPTPPSLLAQWRTQHFGSAVNSGDGADLADPDSDGTVNLIEFATGSDPRAPRPMSLEAESTPLGIEFTYTRSKSALAVATFAVEWSDTVAAGSWSTAGVSEAVENEDGTLQYLRARVPPGTSHRFVRLRVTIRP